MASFLAKALARRALLFSVILLDDELPWPAY